MADRHIFKVAILSHDNPDIKILNQVFGIDFEKSFTQTSGASFSYSHFDVDDHRLTAQFWILDPSSQWTSIRNLYARGASGIILLHNPTIKNADAINKKMIREFFSVNRFPVPIIVFNIGSEESLKETEKFAKDIERWTGYEIPVVHITDENTMVKGKLSFFMQKVKDWRAKNIVFQTLKLYFSLDAVNNQSRSAAKIISQLRRIFVSKYYELVTDEQLTKFVQQAAYMDGFMFDPVEMNVIYRKKLSEHPWEDIEAAVNQNDMSKPSVKKVE